MAFSFTLNEAQFLGFGFELILYGIYVVLFIIAFQALTWRRKTQTIHKFYLFFCCLIFSLCTMHVFIKFRYLFKDLILHPTGVIETGAPALRFADALVTIVDFLAELVLTYRLWDIWGRNYYIVIIPLIMSVVFIALAMSTIGILTAHPNLGVVPARWRPLGTSSFAVPLAFNVLVTGLIIGRIWYYGRQRKRALQESGAALTPQNYLMRAAAVIIESGALYLLVQFPIVILIAMSHPAVLIISDAGTQVYGIAPTLIFVRVAFGNAIQTTNSGSGQSFMRFSNRNQRAVEYRTDIWHAESTRGKQSSMSTLPISPNVEEPMPLKPTQLGMPENVDVC